MLTRFFITLFALSLVACGKPSDPPVELGTIQWGRDLDVALKESAKSGKPVFLLFQEVPG